AQNFATSGEVEVFGENPYENARVLSRMCFVRESQKYPEDSNAKHALANARLFFPHWDQALAEELIDEFRLPLKTTIKKLSRGHVLRRTLPRLRRGGPADLLRPSHRRLRGPSPHGRALEPPHR